MPISIPRFLSYLLLIGSAPSRSQSQISASNCSDPTLTWSYNSLQQSPCFVGASLQAVCNDGVFDIPSLLPTALYVGPHAGKDNACICNTVVYSLISACAACQQGGWISYSSWVANCTKNETIGVLPLAVPQGTQVPEWAYIVPFINDSWNLTIAKAVGDNIEVTGTFTFSPTASGSGPSSTSTRTSHANLNRGRIEGGVIGGVVGATLISGLLVWFVRRWRARCAPSIADTMGEIEQPVTNSLAIETPRLYDPSDPTTYPRREFQPQRFGCTSYMQPSNLGYSGLPEV